jgi:hypothetical protein
MHLGEIWPQAVSFEELYSAACARADAATGDTDREILAQSLLGCYGAGAIQLQAHRPRFTMTPCERPTASAVAREQARSGEFVSSLAHKNVRLEDKLARILLGLLDGARDRTTLLREFSAQASAAGFDGGRITRDVLDAALERLGKSALLLD